MTAVRNSPAATALWIGVGLALLGSLLRPIDVLPGNGFGLRAFRTPPLTNDATYSQSFAMTAGGFNAVEVRPSATSDPADGTITFTLSDAAASAPVAVHTATAERVLRDGWYGFTFGPIEASKDHVYRLDITASQPQSGVRFWATRGVGYADGRLFANGRERWADLLFRTEARTATIAARMWNGGAGILGPSAMLAIGIVWLAVGWLLRSTATLPAA